MASSRRHAVRGLMESSRLVLLIGFGGLLSIMALAGIDAMRVLKQYRRNDDQIRRRYLAQNNALNEIRSDVYVSGTYIRDYLLEPDSGRAETYRTNLSAARRQMESALESYGSQADPLELGHYAALRSELMDYWACWLRFFNGAPAKDDSPVTHFCATKFSRAARACFPWPTASPPSTNNS